MKKSSLYVIALLLSGLMSISDAHAFEDSVTYRRADSITHFFIGSWGPFDDWPQANPAHNRFGNIGQVTPFRYYNLSDSLGFNAEVRGFWDYPDHYPAPPDSVLGGTRMPFTNVLGIEPQQIYNAFNSAQYLRYEFERHQKQTASTEYLGFLDHDATGGQEELVGANQKVAGATFPMFLAGSSRIADTAFNALVLNTDSDNAGVFADSMWHTGIYMGANEDDSNAFYARPTSRKMKMRIRVKVTESVADSNTVLFRVIRIEVAGDAEKTVLVTDTQFVRVNSAFEHVGKDFETISLPVFFRHADTRRLYFSFYWPDEASAAFDHMELLTAHIEPSDSEQYVNVGSGNWGSDRIAQGWASTYSAEDFLSDNPVELINLIDSIIVRYKNKVNFVRIGDEFPFAQGLPFKRLVKLFRDRCHALNASIEIAPFTVDSGTGWFGVSVPNAHVYNFEGARLGWVDTSKYADPKLIFFDPYVINSLLPLPRRIAIDPADTDSLRKWEIEFMTTRADTSLPGSNGITQRRIWDTYSNTMYLKRSQFRSYEEYLNSNRRARRWTERQNNGSRWGILWEAGASPELVEQVNQRTNTPLDNYWLSFNSLRPPTGAEMKVTGHLATSCGSSGLLLYLLHNPKPGRVGPNGGIITSTGNHDSMYYTPFVVRKTGEAPNEIRDTAFGKVWLGVKERYDTMQKLIPMLKVYGNTLHHSQFIGEWRASDLLLADSISKAKMPFLDSSASALNDSLQPDVYAPTLTTTGVVYDNAWPMFPIVADTSNRTFVHISLWLDTTGGNSDTMLYITNMRTDDSYSTAGIPTTIDRRYISLKLKRQHFVTDILDNRSRANGKLLTPYVGIPNMNTLTVRLLPGDGILVRLE